jgi:hypothetical protein
MGSFVIRFVLAVVAILGIGLLGTAVYQAGVAAGIAADAPGTAPAVLPYGWYGPGFGFFGFLGFLLVLFLVFGLFRAAFGGGRRGWGGGPGRWDAMGPDGRSHRWDDRRHEAFEAWHRRAHGQSADADGSAGTLGRPDEPTSATSR